MRYSKIKKGVFIDRPNRFIAHVLIDGKTETVHVKNTGRCKELLLPDAVVYLEESGNPARRTKYDLVAVEKAPQKSGTCAEGDAGVGDCGQHASGGRGAIGDSKAAGVCFGHERGGRNCGPACDSPLLVNMDSQAPNKVAQEWILSHPELFPKITLLKPEYSLGDSRFDFYLEYDDKAGRHHKKLIEVKGCTLEKAGAALFPDAPTLRGLKHVQELTSFQKRGEYEAMVLIIVQMRGCKYFAPNRETQPAFGDALHEAKRAGVEVMAVECDIKPDSIEAGASIEVRV